MPEKRRLLVVDDEVLVRDMLTQVLSREFEVVTVTSGEEAIAKVKSELFPVVFLDLRMAGMSGLQTLRVLRALNRDQKVVILTAHKSTESAMHALNLGAFNYLAKPCDASVLNDVARRAFEEFFAAKARTDDFRMRLEEVHDSFFGVLCHEVNTPLNSIIGYASLIADDLESGEHREAVEEIARSGDELDGLFREMIDYMGAIMNPRREQVQEFDTTTLELMIEKEMGDRGILLKFLFHRDLTHRRVLGPLYLLELLCRKLANALSRYTNELLVEISLAETEDPVRSETLIIHFGRTGLLAAAREFGLNINHLFELYADGGDRGKPRPQGLGLEFATCKRLATASGMRLECRLDGDGDYGLYLEVPKVVSG